MNRSKPQDRRREGQQTALLSMGLCKSSRCCESAEDCTSFGAAACLKSSEGISDGSRCCRAGVSARHRRCRSLKVRVRPVDPAARSGSSQATQARPALSAGRDTGADSTPCVHWEVAADVDLPASAGSCLMTAARSMRPPRCRHADARLSSPQRRLRRHHAPVHATAVDAARSAGPEISAHTGSAQLRVLTAFAVPGDSVAARRREARAENRQPSPCRCGAGAHRTEGHGGVAYFYQPRACRRADAAMILQRCDHHGGTGRPRPGEGARLNASGQQRSLSRPNGRPPRRRRISVPVQASAAWESRKLWRVLGRSLSAVSTFRLPCAATSKPCRRAATRGAHRREGAAPAQCTALRLSLPA